MVGEGTVIGERCSVKKSIIGNHCVIGKNIKITNSIIMDYVTIEDGTKLEGVIIGQRAKISSRCQLKDCEVAGGVVVAAEGFSINLVHAKGESLVK